MMDRANQPASYQSTVLKTHPDAASALDLVSCNKSKATLRLRSTDHNITANISLPDQPYNNLHQIKRAQ